MDQSRTRRCLSGRLFCQYSTSRSLGRQQGSEQSRQNVARARSRECRVTQGIDECETTWFGNNCLVPFE